MPGLTGEEIALLLGCVLIMAKNDAGGSIRAASKNYAVVVRHEINERLIFRNINVRTTCNSIRAYGGAFVNIARIAGVRAGIS